VSLERLLELAAALSLHLIDHAPFAEPSSPPRKSRGRRTAANADDAPAANARGNAGAVRGKRKKVAGGGGAEDEDEERDVLVVAGQEEGVESWCALLAGLCELCCGLGAALRQELCESC